MARKTKTSNEVKQRWYGKNFDPFKVSLPKGMRDQLKSACQQEGVSMNSVFLEAAKAFLERHPVKDAGPERTEDR